MTNLAEECDRFSMSNRSAGYLINALLKDTGKISEYNQKNIIDQSKIRCEHIKKPEDYKNIWFFKSLL